MARGKQGSRRGGRARTADNSSVLFDPPDFKVAKLSQLSDKTASVPTSLSPPCLGPGIEMQIIPAAIGGNRIINFHTLDHPAALRVLGAIAAIIFMLLVLQVEFRRCFTTACR